MPRKLIRGVEQTLCGDRHAGNRDAGQGAGDEEGSGEQVEPPVECRLAGAAVLVDEPFESVSPKDRADLTDEAERLVSYLAPDAKSHHVAWADYIQPRSHH